MSKTGNDRTSRSKEEKESEVFNKDAYETPPHTVRSLLMREPKIFYSKMILEPCVGRGAIARELETFGTGEPKPLSSFSNREPGFKGQNALMVGDIGVDTDFIHYGEQILGSEFTDQYWSETHPISRIVYGSDIREGSHIYGRGGIDFLDPMHYPDPIFSSAVLNPPFGPPGHATLGEEIILRALECVIHGGIVAVLQRCAFTESRRRYNSLWSTGQLRRIYQFTDRVNMYPEGMVDHSASGQMAYSWFVFEKGGNGATKYFWIEDIHSTWGPGGLLPQQVNECEWCGLKSSCSISRYEDRMELGCDWRSVDGLRPKDLKRKGKTFQVA